MSTFGAAGFRCVELPGMEGIFLVRESAVEDLMLTARKETAKMAEAFVATERGTVLEFVTASGTHVAVRRYRHGGVAGRLFGSLHLGWSRARKELEASEYARQQGLVTAEILGIRMRKMFGPVCELELLSRKIPNAESLEEKLLQEDETGIRRELVRQVGRSVREMHDAGLYHADLHIRNILVSSTPDGIGKKIHVLDLDRSRVGIPLSLGERSRNLFRLNRSLRKFGIKAGQFSEADRLCFLRSYFSAGEGLQFPGRKWMVRCERHLKLHQFWWRLCGKAVCAE